MHVIYLFDIQSVEQANGKGFEKMCFLWYIPKIVCLVLVFKCIKRMIGCRGCNNQQHGDNVLAGNNEFGHALGFQPPNLKRIIQTAFEIKLAVLPLGLTAIITLLFVGFNGSDILMEIRDLLMGLYYLPDFDSCRAIMVLFLFQQTSFFLKRLFLLINLDKTEISFDRFIWLILYFVLYFLIRYGFFIGNPNMRAIYFVVEVIWGTIYCL